MAPPPKKLQTAPIAKEPDLDAAIAAYEAAVEQCRVAYDRYFSGVERREPQDVRRRCEALARALPDGGARNVAAKFRMQTLKQRWMTYAQHWARVVRQIEEGTFKRDRDRAEKRFGTPAQPSVPGGVEELSATDLSDDDDDSVTDVTELVRRAADRSSRAVLAPLSAPFGIGFATPMPPSSNPITLAGTDLPPPGPPRPVEQYRAVFERYVAERHRLGDPQAATLRFESVATQLRATETALRAKYTDRQIDFDVTLKDGKVVLRPVVK